MPYRIDPSHLTAQQSEEALVAALEDAGHWVDIERDEYGAIVEAYPPEEEEPVSVYSIARNGLITLR